MKKRTSIKYKCRKAACLIFVGKSCSLDVSKNDTLSYFLLRSFRDHSNIFFALRGGVEVGVGVGVGVNKMSPKLQAGGSPLN